MTTRTCSRCDCELERPHPQNCNYVRSDDFTREREREVHYALKHTEDTQARVSEVAAKLDRPFDAVAAEMARPNAPQKIATPDGDELEFSIPLGEFNQQEVDSPSVSQLDEVAYVYTETETTEIAATGLVCPDCTKDDDELIWGVDA